MDRLLDLAKKYPEKFDHTDLTNLIFADSGKCQVESMNFMRLTFLEEYRKQFLATHGWFPFENFKEKLEVVFVATCSECRCSDVVASSKRSSEYISFNFKNHFPNIFKFQAFPTRRNAVRPIGITSELDDLILKLSFSSLKIKNCRICFDLLELESD